MDKSSRVAAYIGLVSTILLSACSPDREKTRIVARIGSPDGTRDAVYAEDMSGGATVGPSEDVYVVAKGRFPRLQDRVFGQERVCNLRVRWLNNDAIEIGYSARTARPQRTQGAGPVHVSVKWLGRDVASGC